MSMHLIKHINKINKKIAKELSVDGAEYDCNVSELQMHKILFILYGAFYKHFEKELFNANFEAWKYGPVEINYRKYCNESSSDYYLKNFDIKFTLTKKQNEYLNKLINILLKKSVWTLIELTHLIPAWKNNFKENESHCKIPNKDIHKSFKSIEV